MTINIRLCPLIILILFFCTGTFRAQEKFKYDENVEFDIYKVDKWSRIQTGNGYFYTKKGFKYYMVYMTLTNTSDKRQLVDFTKFYLIDIDKKIKYDVELALSASIITWIYPKRRKKLAPQQEKKVKIAITCPEDLVPRFLMLEENHIFPIDPEVVTKRIDM